ncbi:MAG: O-antigen ligase family protein [Limnochordaceae bacterium]|nr:O-antigen ligase family protein [Limnochordaceae bacterium]
MGLGLVAGQGRAEAADWTEPTGKVPHRQPSTNALMLEKVAWHAGAVGLAVGFTSPAQLLLLGSTLYRLATGRASLSTRSYGRLPLRLLAVWLVVPALLAQDRASALGTLLGAVLTGWLSLTTVAQIRACGRQGVHRLVAAFLGTAALAAGYLVVRAVVIVGHTGLHTVLPRQSLPTLNVNSTGTVLMAAAVLSLACAAWAGRRWRGPAAIAFVATVAGLFLTQSRGALLGLLAGILTLGLTTKRQLAWAVAGLVLIFALAVAAVGFPSILGRYGTITSLAANQDRVELWKGAWDILRGHWPVGVGPNNFPHAYASYLVAHHLQSTTQPFAHNVFLDMALMGGIPALGLFVWMLGAAMYHGWRSWHERQDLSAAGALALLVALLVHLQVDLTLFSLELLPLFFLPYGLLTLASAADGEEPGP